MSEVTVNPAESGWTKENILKLCAALKSSIPQRFCKITYSKGLKHIDWNKVAFSPFSPEACKTKWIEILCKMQKIRTLTELISEAEEILLSPVPKNEIHPDFLKKPIAPTAIFYEENWAKLRAQNPELSHKKMLQFVANEYKSLSNTQKAQYVNKHKLAHEEYVKKKQELKPPQKKTKKQYQLSTKDSTCLPSKPPGSGYRLFCKEQPLSKKGLSSRRSMTVYAEHWRGLTKSQRDEYTLRSMKLKRKYETEMNEYLSTFNEEEQQRILQEHGLKRPVEQKRPRQVKLSKKLPGEPKMPSWCAHVAFVQSQMKHFKEEFPNSVERLAKVSKMWHNLSVKEKLCYNKKVDEKMSKYSVDLQTWFKTLTSEQQDEYWKSNPSKHQFLDVKGTNKETYANEEQSTYIPSDSEDEIIEVSSSSEDELDNEDDEDEDEDGDITFDM